jgi:O-antigen ligase
MTMPAQIIDWLRLLLLVWSGTEEPRARRVRIGLIDFFIALLAIALPWSTTLSTVLAPVILIMMLITHGPRVMINEIARPACGLPLALVALAFIGMMWGGWVPWPDRLHALEKVLKLLWILPFFVHFRKTSSIRMVFGAYAASNLLLLATSILIFFSPDLGSLIGSKAPGVPLKSYIDQSQGFSLIAVVLSAYAAEGFRSRDRVRPIVYLFVSMIFFADLVFVNIARTAFLYLPAMVLLIVLRYARGWSSLAACIGIVVFGIALWATSGNLQSKVSRLLKEAPAFENNSPMIEGSPAGGAERLEFWRKSIGFVSSAPIFGHGTGSTKGLFAAEVVGNTGIRAKIVDNPHNQLLAGAVQWGAVGCIILCCMWVSHLWLFREGMERGANGLLAWIGLVAVIQNILSSVLNSHLFDFYQGWLYVLVVGIVGGQLQRNRDGHCDEIVLSQGIGSPEPAKIS